MNPLKIAAVKRWPGQVFQWQHFTLLALVIISLALHFAVIWQPPEVVFDEKHYIEDGRTIIEDRTTARGEHPPLARLIIVGGMLTFGDNPLGWRFFPIVFGTACIVLFYFICRRLGLPEEATLIATFLFTLEDMTFTQASVAMLDVFCLAFMLGAFLLYLRGNYPFAAIMVGLAALAKLNGALALAVIGLHWLFAGRPAKWYFLSSMMLAPIVFAGLLPLLDFCITGQFKEPISRISYMLSQTSVLTFADYETSIATRPWWWLMLPMALWYWYDPRYLSAISYNVWALIIPTMGYMTSLATKRNKAALFSVCWFAGTYLPWIPGNIITDRLTHLFYFYPTIGSVCIGLGMLLAWLLNFWRTRDSGKLRWAALAGVIFYLLLHIAFFVILSPVFDRWVNVFEYFFPPY